MPFDKSCVTAYEMNNQRAPMTLSRNIGPAPVPAVLCVHHTPTRRNSNRVKLYLAAKPLRCLFRWRTVVQSIRPVE